MSFDGAGTGVEFKKIHLADVVKDAPIPVGGTLKVISGQKLVLESEWNLQMQMINYMHIAHLQMMWMQLHQFWKTFHKEK